MKLALGSISHPDDAMNDDKLSQFVNSRLEEIPGTVIFAKLWGSRSHNVHTTESDYDYLGVFVAPGSDLMGLRGITENTWPPKKIAAAEKVDGKDITFYEAGHFAKLLLVGNPVLLEMLYTEKNYLGNVDCWMPLRLNREHFLSKKAVRQYLGYACGQFERLKKHGGVRGLHTTGGAFNHKWAYHMFRVLTDGLRIAEGKEPVVWFADNDPVRRTIMEIRNGEHDQAWLESVGADMVAKIESALASSHLPECGDEVRLNKWLTDIRLRSIFEKWN